MCRASPPVGRKTSLVDPVTNVETTKFRAGVLRVEVGTIQSGSATVDLTPLGSFEAS